MKRMSEDTDDDQDRSLFEGATTVPDDVDVMGGRREIEIDADKRGPRERQIREEFPAPVPWLLEYESDNMLVDLAIELYLEENDEAFSKSQLSEMTGISRASVQRQIPKHVAVGMWEEDDSGAHTRYRVGDNEVMKTLVALHFAILDAVPDDVSKITGV